LVNVLVLFIDKKTTLTTRSHHKTVFTPRLKPVHIVIKARQYKRLIGLCGVFLQFKLIFFRNNVNYYETNGFICTV